MNKIFNIIFYIHLLSATILYTSEKPHVSFGVSDNGDLQSTFIEIPRVKFSKQLWFSKKEQERINAPLYAAMRKMAFQPPYNGKIENKDLKTLAEKVTDILSEQDENSIAARVIKKRRLNNE